MGVGWGDQGQEDWDMTICTGLVKWTFLMGVVIMEDVQGLTGRQWEKPQGPS